MVDFAKNFFSSMTHWQMTCFLGALALLSITISVLMILTTTGGKEYNINKKMMEANKKVAEEVEEKLREARK